MQQTEQTTTATRQKAQCKPRYVDCDLLLNKVLVCKYIDPHTNWKHVGNIDLNLRPSRHMIWDRKK